MESLASELIWTNNSKSDEQTKGRKGLERPDSLTRQMNIDSGFRSSSASKSSGKSDPEMKAFVQEQMAIAQIRDNIDKMTETCWNICMDKPKDKLDGRTETCLTNCVQRNIDCALFISNRYMKKLQGQA